MTTRHELLQQLHELLQPKVYLEIGVQHGWSLQLSKAEMSIGIDPEPLISDFGHHHIFKMTSDDFFRESAQQIGKGTNLGYPDIDLAFIDGMHLAEFAWRDFLNVAKYCHAGSVVVFDDVLPYTSEMAAREICPGDWTGDVWKVFYELRRETDYVLQMVDTSPTGTLVVTGFDDHDPDSFHRDIGQIGLNAPVFPEVLDRRHAWSAPAVIENLKDRGFGK
jgi:predicted O-methyltransferase YrrM